MRDTDGGGTALGDGRVALVTGSTDGIGAATAHNLAATGATVVVHGRDREKGERVVTDLPGEGHAFYAADFSDPGDVRDLADRVFADFDRLDALVNNAGTWQGERHLVDLPGCDAGVEFSFAVNHLAPVLLTNLLADRLVETGARRADECEGDDGRRDATGDPAPTADPARVVTVSSDLHRRADFDLDDARGPDGPSGVDAYALSKLANVLFTFELTDRLPETVTATCCHPGVSPSTGLSRDGSLVAGAGWTLFGLVGGLFGLTDSAGESAETVTYLAASPTVRGTTGEYFDDCESVPAADAASDRDARRRLWEASVEWVALGDDETVGAGADAPPADS